MFISSAFAQTSAPGGASGGLTSLIFPVVLIAALYFIVMRPQMKRQKELKALIDNLAKGDEVLTTGGLYGKISKLGDTILHLEVAPDTEVQVQRAAVQQVLPKGTIK